MTTCPRCSTPVLTARDHVTGEQVTLDRYPRHGGRVEVLRTLGGFGGLFAFDYITSPAPRQPAHELHSRTCTSPIAEPPVNLDDDPVREQSGGWRR
jgi:hypothetical protein